MKSKVKKKFYGYSLELTLSQLRHLHEVMMKAYGAKVFSTNVLNPTERRFALKLIRAIKRQGF